ncbi:glutarate dioxygenase GlaH [Bacillus sp. FJAT-44742]|uniref:glutarate dioxygenase GlaH n=1 Tax=Bacillus sp. FJAT-44742 TaxID=2014005 RepID=UPI000C2486EE|nr:glutarate dioxygenase GlaH [Bacillus sp. FJAT-44742]
MSMLEQDVKRDFVKEENTFRVSKHPQSNRLYHIEISDAVVRQFFSELKDMSTERLEYVPYNRFIAAAKLEEVAGPSFSQTINSILHDRASGGFTIGVKEQTNDVAEYILFSTALSHLIGEPNFDAMSGKYYARFTVKDTDNSDSYLRQAYRRFTLHTDGTFVDEPTDWLLMMKMAEEHAVGGESRLLHLDDWKELERFTKDPLASYEFTYKAPASKNVQEEVKRKTFFLKNNNPCICFIDQFAYPESIQQAKYLRDLSSSMEEDENVIELNLPTGNLVMLNNLFWLHGRAAFEKNVHLHRELLRQRGQFLK